MTRRSNDIRRGARTVVKTGGLKSARLFGIFSLVVIISSGGFLVWKVAVEFMGRFSWCQVKYIDIVGLERISEEELLQVAAIEPGTNLMKLSLDSVAQRIHSICAVRDAFVVRQLPNRLVINVYERQPLAAIAQGDIALVDEEAVVFARMTPGMTIDLPVITHTDECSLEYGFRTSVRLLRLLVDDYPAIYRNLTEVRITECGLALRLINGNAEVVLPGRVGFPQLKPDDLIDTTELIDYLSEGRCSQLPRIGGKIADTIRILNELNLDTLRVPYSAAAIILDELNRCITGKNIYDEDLFEGCSFPSETREMLTENPAGLDRQHLNRRLIEGVLPNWIKEYRLVDGDIMMRLDCYLTQKAGDLPPDLKYVDLRFSNMVIAGKKARSFSPN